MTFCLQVGDVERQDREREGERESRGERAIEERERCRDGLIDKCREGGTWNYSTALIPHVFFHLVAMMMMMIMMRVIAGAGHG